MKVNQNVVSRELSQKLQLDILFTSFNNFLSLAFFGPYTTSKFDTKIFFIIFSLKLNQKLQSELNLNSLNDFWALTFLNQEFWLFFALK